MANEEKLPAHWNQQEIYHAWQQVIALYKLYTVLYNPPNGVCNLPDTIENSWEQIAHTAKLTVKQCRYIIRNKKGDLKRIYENPKHRDPTTGQFLFHAVTGRGYRFTVTHFFWIIPFMPWGSDADIRDIRLQILGAEEAIKQENPSWDATPSPTQRSPPDSEVRHFSSSERQVREFSFKTRALPRGMVKLTGGNNQFASGKRRNADQYAMASEDENFEPPAYDRDTNYGDDPNFHSAPPVSYDPNFSEAPNNGSHFGNEPTFGEDNTYGNDQDTEGYDDENDHTFGEDNTYGNDQDTEGYDDENDQSQCDDTMSHNQMSHNRRPPDYIPPPQTSNQYQSSFNARQPQKKMRVQQDPYANPSPYGQGPSGHYQPVSAGHNASRGRAQSRGRGNAHGGRSNTGNSRPMHGRGRGAPSGTRHGSAAVPSSQQSHGWNTRSGQNSSHYNSTMAARGPISVGGKQNSPQQKTYPQRSQSISSANVMESFENVVASTSSETQPFSKGPPPNRTLPCNSKSWDQTISEQLGTDSQKVLDVKNKLLSKSFVPQSKMDSFVLFLRQTILDLDNPVLVDLAVSRCSQVLADLYEYKFELHSGKKAPDFSAKRSERGSANAVVAPPPPVEEPKADDTQNGGSAVD